LQPALSSARYTSAPETIAYRLDPEAVRIKVQLEEAGGKVRIK
jgi:hypothetical protein